jgi:hypothetical protein
MLLSGDQNNPPPSKSLHLLTCSRTNQAGLWKVTSDRNNGAVSFSQENFKNNIAETLKFSKGATVAAWSRGEHPILATGHKTGEVNLWALGVVYYYYYYQRNHINATARANQNTVVAVLRCRIGLVL